MKIKILKLPFELKLPHAHQKKKKKKKEKKKNLCLDLSRQMLKKYQTIIHLLKEIS